MTYAGAEPVLISGWECRCVRCSYSWVSPCACPPVVVSLIHGGPAHLVDCRPPARCSRCASENWWIPQRWKHGQGTSPETLRRRKVKARE